MIIHIEGFDQNNNFINKKINPGTKKIKELQQWKHYDWYKDGIQLSTDYDDWIDNENYEVIYNYEYINLYIKINNNHKIIMTPLICRKSTIEELKNILSIKDNIYFKQIKLNDCKTLEYYNINNMDSLSINMYNNIYSSAFDC